MNGADTETASRPLAFSTEHGGPGDGEALLGLGGGQPGAVAGQALEQDGRLREQQVGVGWSACSMIVSARICPR